MISVQVDEKQVKELYREELVKVIRESDVSLVYWDAKELMRRTCMSWNNIQKLFFYDKRFPKKKLGGKWYFDAKATQQFLEKWIEEQ